MTLILALAFVTGWRRVRLIEAGRQQLRPRCRERIARRRRTAGRHIQDRRHHRAGRRGLRCCRSGPRSRPSVSCGATGRLRQAKPQASQLFPAWNQYRIEVRGDAITVNLNGIDTAQYTNTDPTRGRFSPTEPTFVGLQSYSNYSFTTGFRNIRVTVL
jgi:hypothetical protein